MNRLKLLILADFRERYSSFLIWLGETLNILIGIFIYRFTAKAFAPNFEFHGVKLDYFNFIIIGEVALAIPFCFMEGTGKFIKTLHQHQIFDEVLLQGTSTRTLFSGATMEVPRTLYRVLVTLAFSALLFDLPVNPAQVLKYLGVTLIFVPAYIGFGLFLAAGMLFSGRGWRTVTTLALALSILSGAYFPTQVLPEQLSFLTGAHLPHVALINGVRFAFLDLTVSEFFNQIQGVVISALVWGAVFSVVGLVSIKWSLSNLRKRPGGILIHEA